MTSITVSAPGKLMLFGEHAVVYGRPCIVTAIDQRLRATVERIDVPELVLNAPSVHLSDHRCALDQLCSKDAPKGARFVECAVKNFKEQYGLEGGVSVTTSSDFTSTFGFGSSSAATVCTLKALCELTGTHLNNKELFDLCYKTVLDVQGKGSGFDIAAAIYGGTVYFQNKGEIIEPLEVDTLPMVIGYTGVKADTVTIVNEVLELADREPELVESLYDGMEQLVLQAQEDIEAADWQQVGELLNLDQDMLSKLGVSSDILDAMIDASIEAGAYGAKLSGAGRGDCMFAFCDDAHRSDVSEAIERAGGQVMEVGTGAEGVRMEMN